MLQVTADSHYSFFAKERLGDYGGSKEHKENRIFAAVSTDSL